MAAIKIAVSCGSNGNRVLKQSKQTKWKSEVSRFATMAEKEQKADSYW